MGGQLNYALMTDLEKAIDNHELILYYQPQFNLTTSNFDGVEALVRWQHLRKGLMQPNQFIRMAEKSDLIIRLGEWVLRTACQQCKHWQNRGSD